jgi:peptidoglycan/LPS O-acetylase OafA/YrhL
VLVVGPLHTSAPLSEYFTALDTYKFLLKNSLLIFVLEHHLPSVFNTSGPASMVNAPLWTLVFEVYLYLLIGLLGALFLRSGSGSTRLFKVLLMSLSCVALAFYIYNITTQGFDSKLLEHCVRF